MPNRNINLSAEEQKEILTYLPESSKLRKKIERAGRTIKVSSGKAKGMGFQKWICIQLSELLGIPYSQGDDESEIASRSSGVNGVDIILRGRARKLFPFSIEAKCSESLNMVDTVEQAEANKIIGTDWLIVHRRKAIKEEIVIMTWDCFIKLFKGGR